MSQNAQSGPVRLVRPAAPGAVVPPNQGSVRPAAPVHQQQQRPASNGVAPTPAAPTAPAQNPAASAPNRAQPAAAPAAPANRPPVASPQPPAAQPPALVQQTGLSKAAMVEAAQEQAILNRPPEKCGVNDTKAYLRSPEFRSELHAITKNDTITDNAIEAAVTYISDPTIESYRNLCECDARSVGASVKKLTALGLTANSYSGEAYLVPRKSKGTWTCTPVPGVIGWERKIREAFPKATIEARTVYDQDEIITDEGTSTNIVYRRNLRPDRTKPNPIVAAFSVIREQPGESRVHVRVVAIHEQLSPKTTEGGTPVKAADGSQVMQKTWVHHEGRVIATAGSGRMTPDKACSYSAQRAAMRDVARTWAAPESTLGQMLAMEDESHALDRGIGEAEGGSQKLDFKARRKATFANKSDAAASQPKEVPVPDDSNEQVDQDQEPAENLSQTV